METSLELLLSSLQVRSGVRPEARPGPPAEGGGRPRRRGRRRARMILGQGQGGHQARARRGRPGRPSSGPRRRRPRRRASPRPEGAEAAPRADAAPPIPDLKKDGSRMPGKTRERGWPRRILREITQSSVTSCQGIPLPGYVLLPS